jgi:hypothetical protein
MAVRSSSHEATDTATTPNLGDIAWIEVILIELRVA